MSAHLVQPSFDRPTRYLPIDHPGAMRWYLRTLFVAGSPRMRAVRGVLSVLARRRGAPLLAAASPRALVVATMGVADTPRGSPDGSPGDRLIVLTSGYDAASRAVAIPFASGAAVPMIVVKVATGAHAAEATLGEHRRLGELHTLLPADLAAALPRPTGTTSIAGRAACIQTCAPGPSMSATTGAWARTIASKQIDLDVVVDWLTAFATATRLNTEGGWADWVDVFAEARRTLTPPADVDVLLATADGLARSTGLATAAVQQHFDPGPWNVHVDGRRPFLIDWEVDGTRRTRSSGPHLADVLYLATYWYFQVMRIDGPDEETAAVARLFAEPAVHDRGVAAVRAAIDRSLAAADLDRSCVPAVLGAMWAERALYTHRRRSSFGTPLAPGASRPEAFLAVLATHSADLCGPHGWWALPAGSDVDVPVASTASSPAGCAGAGPRRADAG